MQKSQFKFFEARMYIEDDVLGPKAYLSENCIRAIDDVKDSKGRVVLRAFDICGRSWQICHEQCRRFALYFDIFDYWIFISGEPYQLPEDNK